LEQRQHFQSKEHLANLGSQTVEQPQAKPRTPLFQTYTHPEHPEHTFKIYSRVLGLRSLEQYTEKPKKWALLAFSCGYFAGLVAELSPQGTKVTAHKTFKRYCSRKKQGGGQTKHKRTGGKGNTAGAWLRGENDRKFDAETVAWIRNNIKDIKDCDRIFLRISPWKRSLVVNDELIGQERVVGFPFGIRRPGYAVLLDCLGMLAGVKMALPEQEAEETEAEDEQECSSSETSDDCFSEDEPISLQRLVSSGIYEEISRLSVTSNTRVRIKA